MRVPLSWLRELVAIPLALSADDIAELAVARGLEIEAIHRAELRGPIVVGRVLSAEAEPQRNGKTIRWCSVDVGQDEPRGIVCGAPNAETGALVVVSLPGAVLPGGFEIAARKTYGHTSDGMICSARELGLGPEHDGILRLDQTGGTLDEAAPGTPAAELLGLDETVLEFAITPDRGYCLSMRGVAREIAGALGAVYTDPAPMLAEPVDGAGRDARDPGDQADGQAPFAIADPRCARVTGVRLSGVDGAAASPGWLRSRLVAAGFRPVSLIVDVTNYVLVELGQPTHAYDADQISGTVVIRAAAVGERLTTLDGTDRALDPADLVIADDTGPIGLAGVMGGERSEISAHTTGLLLESAGFDPVSIARTARRHRLGSEASRRFERGVDPTLSRRAARRVADLLAQLAGAVIEGPGGRDGFSVGAPAETSFPAAFPLDLELSARVLGTDVAPTTAAAALRQVGCEVSGASGTVTVAPPPWRPDLTDPYDLVEEVARVIGYESIAPRQPRAPIGGGLSLAHRRRRRVVDALVGAGLVESPSYPFLSGRSLDGLGIGAEDQRRRVVRVSNPIAGTEPLLRTTLLPGLLSVLRRNIGRAADGGLGGYALFDLGSVVIGPAGGAPLSAPRPPVDARPDDLTIERLSAALPAQPTHLGLVLSGLREPAGWWGPGRPVDHSDAITLVRTAAAGVGVQLSAAAAQYPPWHPGRCALLSAGPVEIGHAGELHPRVCADLELPPRTVAAEIDLDALFAAAPMDRTPIVPSPFPIARADLAFVIADDVPAAALTEAVREGAGPWLETLRIFDVYTGPQVGPGRRSIAYALGLRAPDHTLSDAEVGTATAGAIAAAAARVGADLRS